jgi:hypothetical protein
MAPTTAIAPKSTNSHHTPHSTDAVLYRIKHNTTNETHATTTGPAVAVMDAASCACFAHAYARSHSIKRKPAQYAVPTKQL